jgi:hypothetical protein
METAWILRYELPDAFEEVMIILRDRAQKLFEAPDELPIPARRDASDTSGDEEESAI